MIRTRIKHRCRSKQRPDYDAAADYVDALIEAAAERNEGGCPTARAQHASSEIRLLACANVRRTAAKRQLRLLEQLYREREMTARLEELVADARASLEATEAHHVG